MQHAPKPPATRSKELRHIYEHILTRMAHDKADVHREDIVRWAAEHMGMPRELTLKRIYSGVARGYLVGNSVTGYRVATLTEYKYARGMPKAPDEPITQALAKPTHRAPPPRKPRSKIASIYEVIASLGGTATVSQIKALLPAASYHQNMTRKQIVDIARSSGVAGGYLVINPDASYSIAPLETWVAHNPFSTRVSDASRSAPAKLSIQSIKNVAQPVDNEVKQVTIKSLAEIKLLYLIAGVSLGIALSLALWRLL